MYFNMLDILQLAKNFRHVIVNKNCKVDILDHDRNVGVSAILDFWWQIASFIANVEHNFCLFHQM